MLVALARVFPDRFSEKSRIFRKIGPGCPWKMQPLHISYGPLTQICPCYPGHNPEDAVASFFVGTNFPKYSRHFGKIAATHRFLEIFRIFRGPFSRNIPNISGNATVEISGRFRKNGLECKLSKYPGYFGKMVLALNEAVCLPDKESGQQPAGPFSPCSGDRLSLTMCLHAGIGRLRHTFALSIAVL